MLNPTHPTAVLRNAWRTIHLNAIRTAAQAAIAELEESTRADLLAKYETRRAPEPTFSAMATAFCVCCNELRAESGLPILREVSAPAELIEDSWRVTYASELERYRDLAGSALMRLLSSPA